MKWKIVYSDNTEETITAVNYEAATKTATKNAAKKERSYKVIEEISEPK